MTDQPRLDLPTSEEEWRRRLSPERYAVLREGATEPPFSGELLGVKDDGVFRCAGCGTELFDASTKFESGSGWPSFYDAIDEGRVETRRDTSHGMVRTEILCASCGGHLGHIFPDGPRPTGLRYCVNSLALEFDPEA